MSEVAINAIKALQEEIKKSVEKEFVPENESIEEEKYSKYRALYEKIKPEWKAEDKAALDQLKVAAESTYVDIFGAAFEVLDALYSSVRVPERTSRGNVAKDVQGRTVWALDEFGRPMENWASLDNIAIDKALIKLQDQKFTIGVRVQELFLETLFAKHSLQDLWDDSYDGILDGTTPIRTAKANRKSRDEKWNYFFNYYVWSIASTFEKEINSTIAMLNRIRAWRSGHQEG